MYRDAWVKIDIDAFKDNIKIIKERSNKKIIAIIKADAYGCGAKTIYKYAIEAGVSMFGVSSLEEAIRLREDGCTKDILILGHTSTYNLDLIKKYDFILSTVSKDWVDEFSKFDGENIRIHIKVDTGMNRIGLIGYDEVKESINKLKDSNYCVDGIFTHFACSDEDYNKMTKKQYELFKDIVERLDYKFNFIHCSNSDASMNIKDDLCNSARIGLSLFGLNTYHKDLKPVVSLICNLINVKTVKKGEAISYGSTYVCEKDEIIGTVPIGYADGFNRKNTGRRVYVEGTNGVIVGRICMDQMMIRLDEYRPVGTRVELFGKHISIEEVAKDLDTISYEVLSVLSDRLTRVYFKDGKYLTDINPRLNRKEIS